MIHILSFLFHSTYEARSQLNNSLKRLRLGGDRGINRIGNAELTYMFQAVTEHPALEHLDFKWASVSIGLQPLQALVKLLRDNCKLRSIPINTLVYACEPQYRYLVLDVLKVNVGLDLEWKELLPLDVRTLFRRFRGLPVPDVVVFRQVRTV